MMKHAYQVERDKPVTPDEINALRSSVGWDLVGESYHQVLERGYTHYSVRAEGQLVGFVNILSDGIGDAFLVDLVVHRDHHRDHIGTAIVKRAVRDMTDDGVQCIQVTFNPENEAFYKSIGFHIFKAGIIDNKTMKVNL